MFNKNELNRLYHYALALTRHEDSAYDLLQSALERYLVKSSQSIDSPQAYLKIIMRNLFFDNDRRNKVIPMISMEDNQLSHIEPFDESAMDELLVNQQDVCKLTATLTTDENELLYLWAVEEYTTDEISKIYQQPRGTILSKLHRLKKRIKKYTQTVSSDELRGEK